MISKVGSLEEKVKLPPTETISRCYQQPQGNRKAIRILTVAVYVLCVSLAAIMLSLYYIFIWDPTIRPFVTKSNNCDKIVIPEKIAIRLLNSSEVTADQFYKHILEQYRILNQLQQQRQQFLQQQHIQLQQLAAGNKFQQIFATATIIQSNPSDPLKKPITPTNGTFLLEPRPSYDVDVNPQTVPILDTVPAYTRRKSHRKHYSNHHRHPQPRKSHKKALSNVAEHYAEPAPLNPLPAVVVQEPAGAYTPMPIPLILNSNENSHHTHHSLTDKKFGSLTRKHTSAGSQSAYEAPAYLNPFLTGELIFEK